MLRIALTGGIGCGKSSVCDLFARLDTPIIDTDLIARELVEPGQPALTEITDYFGTEILHSDGSLNRKSLARLIFSHTDNRKQLESILHPKIRQYITQQLEKLNTPYTIIAIPLLIETSQQKHYDRVLLVDCTEQQQIERTLKRDPRNLQEIKAIIKAQASRQEKLKQADDIIDNTAEQADLKAQVNKLHQKYLKLVKK